MCEIVIVKKISHSEGSVMKVKTFCFTNKYSTVSNPLAYTTVVVTMDEKGFIVKPCPIFNVINTPIDGSL